MAENKSEELKFFSESVNKDFFCPVSVEVMRNPHQTDCCGSHISAEVAERLIKDGKPCPLCKVSTFTTHRDQYFQRIILDEKVHCLHKGNGCDWVGSLCELQDHSGTCRYRPWSSNIANTQLPMKQGRLTMSRCAQNVQSSVPVLQIRFYIASSRSTGRCVPWKW